MMTDAVSFSECLPVSGLPKRNGEPAVAVYLRETADAWNDAIESWLYVVGTDLAKRIGVKGY
jgi:glucoamylase